MKKLLLWCMMLFAIWSYAQTTVTIGAGASTSVAGTNGDPIYRSSGTSSFHYSKSVQLLTATDLSTAGVVNGATINSIAFNKTTTSTVSGTNAWTLNVYLKNSSATALASGTSWSTMTSGATLFYSATINSTNNLPAAAGWVTWSNNTSNSFIYGGGAIEVYIDWVPSGTLTSPYTGGAFQWKYDATTPIQAIGTSNSTAIAGTNTTWTTQTRRYQTQVTYTAVACSGTPNPGNTVATATSSSCAGPYSTTLSLQNNTIGTGVTYQWYNGAGAIAGATSSTYSTTVTAADSYYCAVTCTGSTTNSAPVSVSAPIGGISTFPWSENFDSMSTIGAGVVPTCWKQVPGGAYMWTSGNASYTTYNDPKSAPNYMTIYYGTNPSYLWTPGFQLTAGTSYDFSFYFAGDTYTGWTGDVVQNSSQSATGATALGGSFITSTVTSTPNYAKVTRTFVPATSGLYYFGVKVSSDTVPYYLGFDDFDLRTTPTCVEPTFTTTPFSAITSSGATVTWTASTSNPANNYDVYYSTTNTAPTSSSTPNATNVTSPYSITGLNAATTYYVWVRSHCSATDQSTWASAGSFITLCNAFNVPYTENFDTTAVGTSTNNNAPTCWTYLETAGNAGYGYVYASLPNSSPNVYYLYNSSATTGNVMLVSPQTNNLSDGTKRVKFYAKAGSAGYTMNVGTVANVSDPATFTAIGSAIALTASWAQYTVNIPAGTDSYLAFRHGLSTTYASLYIDDVIVESIPTCDVPSGITTASTTTSSTTVSWTAPATTAVGVGYDVYYSSVNTAPTASTVLNTGNSVSTNSTTTTAAISGLSANTYYYIWVRSKCSATDNSLWQGPVKIYTSGYCLPATASQASWISAFTSTGAATNMNYSSAAAVAGTNGYIDLTATANKIVSSSTGSAIPITLTAGGPTVGFTVWIDWDKNGTFDAAEKMYTTTAYTTSTTGATITPPAGQANGDYRMRVVTDYNSISPADPCATGISRGEIVDYTFRIDTTLGTVDLANNAKVVTLYPNPFTDILNISEVRDLTSVSVSDMSGRLVKTIDKPTAQLQLGDLKAGLYLVTLKYKDGTSKTVKAIKK